MSHIVYLDDEPQLTNIFKILFSDTNHQVFTFTREEDALKHCLDTPPDIFFVDYRLEEARGDEVAIQLPKHTRKVLVTGELKVENVDMFDEVIHKPFKLEKILSAVNAIC